MDGCTSARRVLIRSEENDLSEGVFEHYFWGSTFRITSLLLPPSLPFFFFSCPTVSHSSPRRGDPMFSNEDKFLLLLFLPTRGGGIVNLHDAASSSQYERISPLLAFERRGNSSRDLSTIPREGRKISLVSYNGS